LATVTALLTLGPAGLICVLVVLVVTGLVGSCARAYIGGQTGDVLGATQQLCEAAVLISLLMLTA
jgi:adenosylcobinamide-GDP ribazoletransferase